MRIVLDACVPEKLSCDFPPEWEVRSVNKLFPEGTSDGVLLAELQEKRDALIMVDRSLRYQQNTGRLSFGLLTISASSNALSHLRPFVPLVIERCRSIGTGEVVVLSQRDVDQA